MKRFGLTLGLQPDPARIAAYREQHLHVWPEVTARLRECGVHAMHIWLLGERLFMYLETDDAFDPSVDFARINEDPTSARWNALMADLQARTRSRRRRVVGANGPRVRPQLAPTPVLERRV